MIHRHPQCPMRVREQQKFLVHLYTAKSARLGE
jgi:hypothetical protein